MNLEVPLTDEVNPIAKFGLALDAHPATVVGMKTMKIDLFTLGNNHILDQEASDLDSTMKV